MTVLQHVQFDVVIKILSFTASRPAEILRTNQAGTAATCSDALRYGDIDWTLSRSDGGDVTLDCAVTFRLLKGGREDPSKVKVAALLMNWREPMLCPVTPLLALALSDKIFSDFETAEQILKAGDLLEPGKSIKLHIKPDKESLFVLRRIIHQQQSYTSHSQEPLAYGTVNKRIAAIGAHAGFLNKVNLYDLRRGTANALDSLAITASNRKQAMGHSEQSRVFQSYRSGLAAIDVAAYLMGTAEERERVVSVIHAQSHLRHSGPPLALTPRDRLAILRQPEVIELDKHLSGLKPGILERYPSFEAARKNAQDDKAAKEYFQLRGERNVLVEKLYGIAREKQRKELYRGEQMHLATNARAKSADKQGPAVLSDREPNSPASGEEGTLEDGIDLPVLQESSSVDLLEGIDNGGLAEDDPLNLDYDALTVAQIFDISEAFLPELVEDSAETSSETTVPESTPEPNAIPTDSGSSASSGNPGESSGTTTKTGKQADPAAQRDVHTAIWTLPRIREILRDSADFTSETFIEVVGLLGSDVSLGRSETGFYPGEEPTADNRCPKCGKDFSV